MSKVGTSRSYVSTHEWQLMVDRAIASGELKLVSVGSLIPKRNGSIKVELDVKELPDFTDQVNKGAAWLDEIDPGWWRAIDTEKLDLNNENMCVLGQAWSHYARKNELPEQTANRYKAFINRIWPGVRNTDQPADHGFSLAPAVIRWANWRGAIDGQGGARWTPMLWEHLTKTWLVLIQARQEAESEEKRKLVLELEGLTPEEIADRMLEERS